MYYRLGCEYPEYPVHDDGGHYVLEDGAELPGARSWALGQPLGPSLPESMELALLPIADFKGQPPVMFDGSLCLMSRRMVEVLAAAGVDNLEVCPATLRDLQNGREFEYRAVNILGLVAASEIGASRVQEAEGKSWFDTQFSDLTLDSEESVELGIFRLAEDTSIIVVDERVKVALQDAGLPGLTFTALTLAPFPLVP